ncbi:hypothetical protein SDC9_178083 [bioreactor metagenome]|uniref:Uncharacterized protein n=1 Tax=bioreactor metagenome TaxID=1076179 RepID=A0A645GX45_9ZZZZ
MASAGGKAQGGVGEEIQTDPGEHGPQEHSAGRGVLHQTQGSEKHSALGRGQETAGIHQKRTVLTEGGRGCPRHPSVHLQHNEDGGGRCCSAHRCHAHGYSSCRGKLCGIQQAGSHLRGPASGQEARDEHGGVRCLREARGNR